MYAHEVVGVWEKKQSESKFGGDFDLDYSKTTKSFDETERILEDGDDELCNKINDKGLPIGSQITVLDSDRLKYTVTVTSVGLSKLTTGNEETNHHSGLSDLACNCSFFVHNRMLCTHMFAVLNKYQIRSAEKLKPNERWTKRFNWENFKDTDLTLTPNSFA